MGKWDNPDGSRMVCKVSECGKPVAYAALCNAHYQRGWENEELGIINSGFDLCPVSECGRPKVKSGVICKRCNQFRWRYSLTVEDVLEFWLPDNRICSNPGCDSTTRLHMDHDHSCCPPEKFPQSHKVSCGGCVRGWLCKSCNNALGMLEENPQKIRGLLSYIGVDVKR